MEVSEDNTSSEALTETATDNTSDLAGIKIGLICLNDENSPYDLNFINSLETAKQELGLTDDQILIKKNIPETNECKETAGEYPEVQFCHAAGTMR